MFSRVWRDFILFNNIIGILIAVEVSFNQPRFRPNTTWNSNATTFANESVIFVNSNNSIYIPNQKTGEILIWHDDDNGNPSKKISSTLSNLSSIFVTINGDIYVDNGVNHGRIDRWIAANEIWTSIMMNVTSTCYAIFIDIYESLYCSMFDKHRVDKKWLNGETTIVAGAELNTLNHPWGIFVDINLDLYVADSGNNRIQLFRLNQRNGITVAGNGSSKFTIELNLPTGVVLDGDRHLFIVDRGNHRIIGSDENGFRCINDKLSLPETMSFDSYGNIYVTDRDNHRIQKIVKKEFAQTKYSSNTFNPISKFHIEPIFSLDLRATYSSELTKETQSYPRICGKGYYHYQTIQINIKYNGSYTFDTNSSILLYGYLYKNYFDPSYPNQNLLTESQIACGTYHFRFQLGDYLEANHVYILLVTTFYPNVRGSFTILVSGHHNLTLNRINKKHSSCVIGDQCSLFTKGIGLTINDILRNKIQSNIPFRKQSTLIQTVTSITMIMFVIGFFSGIFSLITFYNKELRKVGCGIYLLASSITSLLTITMFTIKFWFVILIQQYSIVRSSILRTDCVFIGPVLKLCLYLDGWLNACVAIERTVNVSKGVNFDKKMSRHAARWVILILTIFVMGTVIHEPIHHELFEYTTLKYNPINNSNNLTTINEYNAVCVIRYSRSVQTYNTITLFIHLIVPFLANLFSALFIIFGTARQRSATRTNKKSFKEQAVDQTGEHKQLLISPFILLLLALPRLIMSLISGCVDPSENPWLYLCGYFISFTPPMLVFAVFVLPSKLYRKTFKDSMTGCRQQSHQ